MSEIYEDAEFDLTSVIDIEYNCFDCNETFESEKKFMTHRDFHKEKLDPARYSIMKGETAETGEASEEFEEMSIEDEVMEGAGQLNSLFEAPENSNDTKIFDFYLECDICKVQIFNRLELIFHTGGINCVTKARFQCDICLERFECKDEINDHITANHLNSNNNCEPTIQITKKTLIDKKLLFECDLCRKKFKFRSQLNQHHVIHTDAKPFNCQICKKRFKRRKSLTKHQKIHN